MNRYHVPRSFIQPGKNKLILFEEMGGDPTKISFTTRQTTSLCGYISESHPAPVDAWNTAKNQLPVLHLECPPYSNQVISSVKFASFGTPSGTCGSYKHGKCRGSSALAIVQRVPFVRPFNALTRNELFCLSTNSGCNGFRHVSARRAVMWRYQLSYLVIHAQMLARASRSKLHAHDGMRS